MLKIICLFYTFQSLVHINVGAVHCYTIENWNERKIMLNMYDIDAEVFLCHCQSWLEFIVNSKYHMIRKRKTWIEILVEIYLCSSSMLESNCYHSSYFMTFHTQITPP